MAASSKIEWTDRSDWNPLRGCTRASAGCVNCYAESIAGRFSDPGQPFHGFATRTPAGARWTGEVEVRWERAELPLGWRTPVRIFANSTSDFFHETLIDHDIAHLFGVMIAAHHLRGHTFQVLTKRAGRMRAALNDPHFWEIANSFADGYVMERTDPLNRRRDDARATLDDYGPENPPPNVWLGVSVEEQARADERIPELLATPAAKRFVSCEPLLGPVDLKSNLGGTLWIGGQRGCAGSPERSGAMHHGIGTPDCPRHLHHHHDDRCRRGLDWVIAGGESGPGARPMHPAWARALRDQCQSAGVPFFFKQWGSWAPVCEMSEQLLNDIYHPAPEERLEATRRRKVDQCVLHADGTRFDGRAMFERGAFWQGTGAMTMVRIGKRRAGRLLDGREWSEFPA